MFLRPNLNPWIHIREIKLIADSLAAIGAPVSSRDWIQHTIMGLGKEYDSLTTIITHFSGNLTFNEVREKLLIQEQIIKGRHTREQGFATHKLFVASTLSPSPSYESQTSTPSSRNNNYGVRGGGKGRKDNRGGRGKGRSGGAKQNQTQSSGCPVICNSVLSFKSHCSPYFLRY